MARVVVIVPELPALSQEEAAPGAVPDPPTDAQELGALARLLLFRPWGDGQGGGPEGLKGESPTWTAALTAAAIPTHQMHADGSAEMKERYLASRRAEGVERDVTEIEWVPLVRVADPALWERNYGRGYCFHCGQQAGPERPLMRCGACRKVSYCSKECQKAAYWHHKRALDMTGEHVGCVQR